VTNSPSELLAPVQGERCWHRSEYMGVTLVCWAPRATPRHTDPDGHAFVESLDALIEQEKEASRQAPVQGERGGNQYERLRPGVIPWQVHALAAREYNRRYEQSAEMLASRGGFSWSELIALFRGDYSTEGVSRAAKELREAQG